MKNTDRYTYAFVVRELGQPGTNIFLAAAFSSEWALVTNGRMQPEMKNYVHWSERGNGLGQCIQSRG